MLLSDSLIYYPYIWGMETFMTYLIYFGTLFIGVLIAYCAIKDSYGRCGNSFSDKELADELRQIADELDSKDVKP